MTTTLKDWNTKCTGKPGHYCPNTYPHEPIYCRCWNYSYSGCIAWWFANDPVTHFTRQYHTDSVIDVMRVVGKQLDAGYPNVFDRDNPYFTVKAIKTNDIRKGMKLARVYRFKYNRYYYAIPSKHLPERICDGNEQDKRIWGIPINYDDKCFNGLVEHRTQYLVDFEMLDKLSINYIEKQLVEYLEKNGGKLKRE